MPLRPKISRIFDLVKLSRWHRATPFFTGNSIGHPDIKIISRLLKVDETCSWAQTNRNMQVYLCCYNIPKLQELYFLCKSKKTEFTPSPFSFSQFTQKVKLLYLELRDVITAQINLHIPVLLSPPTSLYDVQKLIYDIWPLR